MSGCEIIVLNPEVSWIIDRRLQHLQLETSERSKMSVVSGFSDLKLNRRYSSCFLVLNADTLLVYTICK
jgi:hypothetical protein